MNSDPEPIQNDIESGYELENLDGSPENESQGGKLKAIKETTPMEMVAGVVALSAFGSSLAAIIVEQSYVVLAAGILSMVTGPYAYYQQTRLTDIKALKATHAAFVREINYLKNENDRLEKSVEELGSTVSGLEETEFALQTISEIQGQNVALLSEQVEDNNKILDRMQGSLKTAVLNNMLSIIIRCDKDEDWKFDDDEINNLIHRMENINNIEIHDEKFREAIVKNGEDGRALKNVMKLVKKLFSDENSNDIIAFKD